MQSNHQFVFIEEFFSCHRRSKDKSESLLEGPYGQESLYVDGKALISKIISFTTTLL